MKLKVETQFNKDFITQRVDIASDSCFPVNTISREVVHLKEQGIRDALIRLGWTPPPEEKEV